MIVNKTWLMAAAFAALTVLLLVIGICPRPSSALSSTKQEALSSTVSSSTSSLRYGLMKNNSFLVDDNKLLKTQQQRHRSLLPVDQPKVTLLNTSPTVIATFAIGSISMPEGSPWCPGDRAAYWVIGHDPNDRPYCQDANGEWSISTTIVLDKIDELNAVDSNNIDRHDCVLMDVNLDGLNDIICTVGANKGQGFGFNELYLTRSDGSIEKILRDHGLYKYPRMRTRRAVALIGPGNKRNLVWIGVEKGVTNYEENKHTMFRNDFVSEDKKPYFNEVEGPWSVVQSAIQYVVAGDINRNGVDDLVVCYEKARPQIYIQNLTGKWSTLTLSTSNTVFDLGWESVRLGDVSGDGLLDLAVVTNHDTKGSFLYVFLGITKSPFFNFGTPYYKTKLPYRAPDLEILDVNGDGRKDIYVMQTELIDYCKPNGSTGTQPAGWVPPEDLALDFVFVGQAAGSSTKFSRVQLSSSVRGCGGMVRRFGDDKKLLLANANFAKLGYHALLEW